MSFMKDILITTDTETIKIDTSIIDVHTHNSIRISP